MPFRSGRKQALCARHLLSTTITSSIGVPRIAAREPAACNRPGRGTCPAGGAITSSRGTKNVQLAKHPAVVQRIMLSEQYIFISRIPDFD
jgi:hypothetical protein